jgi:hypothetical protein
MDHRANHAAIPLAGMALAILAIASPAMAQTATAAKLDQPAIVIQQSDIKWNGRPGANRVSTLYGGGPTPGKVISITDWVSGQISHPHYHQRDRTFIVLKGHWDFSSGPKDDVNAMKALPEGTVIHVRAGTPFKDGCKQAPCLILTVGESGYPSSYVDENGKDLPPAPRPQGAQ